MAGSGPSEGYAGANRGANGGPSLCEAAYRHVAWERMPTPYQDPTPRPSRPDPVAADAGGVREVDSAEVANLVKIAVWFAPACFIMLSALWYLFFDRGWISGPVFGLLVLLNFPLAAVGVFVINASVGGVASGLVRTIYSQGDLPPPRAYPRQETLVARGQYQEAAEYFRDHLVLEPDDNEARLRLAMLLETQLGDQAGAEALYKEVRVRRPTPREEVAAANGLIDLYRRTRDRGRLMVELARFAERYRGSAAGDAARRELADLKRS